MLGETQERAHLLQPRLMVRHPEEPAQETIQGGAGIDYQLLILYVRCPVQYQAQHRPVRICTESSAICQDLQVELSQQHLVVTSNLQTQKTLCLGDDIKVQGDPDHLAQTQESPTLRKLRSLPLS